MKGKILLLSLVAILGFAFGVAAQDSISFREVSSSVKDLGGGRKEFTFVAVVNLNVVPISFNYHWERSDGAKSQLKVVKVNNTGANSHRIVETWTVGGDVDASSLWEKVFVNSGNTHLVSDAIPALGSAASAPAAAPAPAPAAKAPASGAHPAYLHALSDMRMARALLQGWQMPLIVLQTQDATREIDAAIQEIKEAAISDGKNIDDHPAIDAKMDNRGRLIRAQELLNKAYSDIDEKESNQADLGLRSRALGHISKARGDLSDARKIQKWI